MKLSPVTLAIVGLRAAALALAVSGSSKASDSLYLAADALEAGKATDEHMQLIADKLKARDITQEDWDDVTARIKAAGERLHGEDPPG